ncbi:unnamed protein product [Clonostachys chloroleuca]|uniref:Uncharacterized protein n=1 Tax=Clonostachys chloroleuca TaxID=1926264 RepID=A0AA35QCK2_9HYPO|nr:unnamed protein product [Clonostachys chloroleuca]
MPGRLNKEEPPPQPLSQPPQAEMDRTTSMDDIPGQPDMVPSPISGFSPAHDDNGTTDTENNDKETNGTDNSSRPQYSSGHIDVGRLAHSDYPFEMENTTSMEDIPGQPGEIERNNNATNLPGGEERGQQQPPQTPPSTPAGIDLGQGESGNPTIIDFEPNDN